MQIQPLIIGYKMKSSRMGYITWDEWSDLMKSNIWYTKTHFIDEIDMIFMFLKKNISAANDGKFKILVDQWEESILNDPEEYMQFYLFTFNYAKTTGQKSMDVEVIFNIVFI